MPRKWVLAINQGKMRRTAKRIKDQTKTVLLLKSSMSS